MALVFLFISGICLLLALQKGEYQIGWWIGCFLSLSPVPKLISSARRAAQGEGGEQRIEEALSELDERYKLIRNWVPPGSKGDVDFILLGPFGVLTIEAKTYVASVKCEGDKWFRQGEKGSWRMMKSFSHQLVNNTRKVSKHFRVPSHSFLVFNDRANLRLNHPTVKVLRRKELLAAVKALPDIGFDVEAKLKSLAM